MDTIKRLNKWANSHTSLPLDLLRILLGAFIFYKGMTFSVHTNYLYEILNPLDEWLGTVIIVHYVTMAHLAGGILIIIGLITRIAVLVQIPALIGAVLINFMGVMDATNLIAATIVLVACVFFLAYGSGRHSVDYVLKMQM
ncbi:MAG: hypothetical protein DHS20C17_29490 [Cyclobacteriaceae bacterium]|nr:MAG: hypothetical protein DHS20C17_29490 [Cyclobacteriaceae bacterium]